MEGFPSQLELTAASALLLLPIAVFFEKRNSDWTHFNDDPIEVASKRERSGAKKDKSVTSDSRSADRSWLTSDGSSGAVQARRMKIMSAFTSKLKVLRRRRSKIHRTSRGRRIQASSNLKKSTAPVSFQNASETTSEASCMSGSRSDLSSTLSRREREEIIPAPTGEEVKGRGAISCSSNIRHRAQAILHFLSRGCSSEVRIRQVLGDSPDTSKALRILLKRAEVKRSGAGGRSDPFVYMVSPLSRGTERLC